MSDLRRVPLIQSILESSTASLGFLRAYLPLTLAADDVRLAFGNCMFLYYSSVFVPLFSH